MNELQIFSNDQFGQIRTTVEDGEPLFVAADAEKEWIERERRVNWVSRVGKEQAHKLIESYGEG